MPSEDVPTAFPAGQRAEKGVPGGVRTRVALPPVLPVRTRVALPPSPEGVRTRVALPLPVSSGGTDSRRAAAPGQASEPSEDLGGSPLAAPLRHKTLGERRKRRRTRRGHRDK